MTRPPDAERGGARSLFGARAGGQPPPAGEDELFTDEELSWEDDGAEPAAGEPGPGWPIPRRRVVGEVAPYRRRRVIAGAALGVVAIVGIVLGVTLGGGSNPQATPPTAPSITVETTGPTTTTAAPTTVTLPGGKALKDGATGAQVKALQRALQQLGFDIGKVDGSYGPKTKAAVVAFQQQHNLTADGVAGSKTVAALDAALSG